MKFKQWFDEMALGQTYYHPSLNSKLFNIVKVNEKFAEVMRRLPDITFNVLFVPYDFSFKRSNLQSLMQELGMKMEGTITCIVTENFFNKFGHVNIEQLGGVVLMPANSWGRIHRMAHGLIREDTGDKFYMALRQFFKSHKGLNGFQFKSFRTHNVDHETGIQFEVELYREILTEYIWHGGKIRYKYTQESEKQSISELQQLIDTQLKQLVGTIIRCDE
jgi:hypothetical protein